MSNKVAVTRRRYPHRLHIAAILLAACGTTPAVPLVTQPPPPTFVPTLAPLSGTGIITFGAAYDPDTLEIATPKTSFKTTSKGIAWSASLSEPADATSLTWIVAKASAGGAESIKFKQEHDISNPDFDTLANKADLAFLLNRKAGTYVMRYLRGSEVLAEGKFTLVR